MTALLTSCLNQACHVSSVLNVLLQQCNSAAASASPLAQGCAALRNRTAQVTTAQGHRPGAQVVAAACGSNRSKRQSLGTRRPASRKLDNLLQLQGHLQALQALAVRRNTPDEHPRHHAVQKCALNNLKLYFRTQSTSHNIKH